MLEVAETHKHWCEVHTIGLGPDVCHDLVDGLAAITGGIMAYVGDRDPMINTKVIDALSRAIEPSYT